MIGLAAVVIVPLVAGWVNRQPPHKQGRKARYPWKEWMQ